MELIEELNSMRNSLKKKENSLNLVDQYWNGYIDGIDESIEFVYDYQAWLDTEIENEIYKNEENEDDLSKGYCKGLQKALEIMKGK